MAEIDLRGQTALITGAARRIGREIARRLAGAGVQVVLHYRNSATQARRLAAELERSGVRAWTLPADFQEPAEYERLIERAGECAGSLDILVNNASRFLPGELNALTFQRLMADIEVNAWAPFTLSREFARRTRKGSIVHVLDTRISGNSRTHAAYLLSKLLLARLTALSALEFAPGTRVNAVAPGAILPPPGQGAGYLQRLARRLPLARHGDAGDVAAAVLFLLRSPFITGQIVYVDGGQNLQESWHG